MSIHHFQQRIDCPDRESVRKYTLFDGLYFRPNGLNRHIQNIPSNSRKYTCFSNKKMSTLQLKELQKEEQAKSKVSKRKDITRVRAEINGI